MKDSRYWEEKQCKQCGKIFWVRKCYTKRGQGIFCSTSCGTTYRNTVNNPTRDPEVRLKISVNHYDVSGKNNPMYGRRGWTAPSYKDGRSVILGDLWRKLALINKPQRCEICGNKPDKKRKLHVNHKDGNRKNNNLDNLQVVCSSCHNNKLHLRKRDKQGRFLPAGKKVV